MFQVETRNQLASALAAGMIFPQLLALGAVGGFTAAFFALSELLVCLTLILLLGKEISDQFWIQAGPVMVLFFAALAWAAIPLILAAAPGKLHPTPLAPDATRLELLKLAGAGAACLAGGLIGLSRSRLQRFILNVAVIGLAYTLLALCVGQAPLSVWGQSKGAHAYRFTGTFLNANAAGCVFGMIGLLSLGLLQSLLKRLDVRHATLSGFLWLALVACSVVAAFGACVLTQSRTSLVLSAVLGATIVAIEARRTLKTQEANKTTRVIIGCTAVILALGLSLGVSQISSRWGTFLIDAQLRAEAYLHYLGAITQSPWFGYGLGGFRALHESILTPRLAPAMWDFGAAHSAVTQAALEGGVPFLLLLAAPAALMTMRIASVGAGGLRRGAVVSSIIAATALAFAFSFVDIALNVPAISALCVVLFGVAWGDAVARGVPTPARIRTYDVESADDLSGRDWTRG